MKETDQDYFRLLHIQEAIRYIETFLLKKQKKDFFEDALIRFAVERQLEIIGEAANHLSVNIKDRIDGIEWKRIVSLRNFLAHEYFGVDLELVWDITNTKIPVLKVAVEKFLADSGSQTDI